jgi:hypothetical protein
MLEHLWSLDRYFVIRSWVSWAIGRLALIAAFLSALDRKDGECTSAEGRRRAGIDGCSRSAQCGSARSRRLLTIPITFSS